MKSSLSGNVLSLLVGSFTDRLALAYCFWLFFTGTGIVTGFDLTWFSNRSLAANPIDKVVVANTIISFVIIFFNLKPVMLRILTFMTALDPLSSIRNT